MTDIVNAVALTREHRVQGLTFTWVVDAQKEGTRRGRDHTPRTQLRELIFFTDSAGNGFREPGLMGSTCSTSTPGRGKAAKHKEESWHAAHERDKALAKNRIST